MKMTSGWMRAGVVGAMMVAATMAAGAQTTAEDAAKAAEAEAKVANQEAAQSNLEAQQADVQAREIETQTQAAVQAAVDGRVAADVQVHLGKMQEELSRMAPMQAKVYALNSANMQTQMANMQVQMAKMAPMEAKLQLQMLPMMAKMEVGLAPMQAEMMARSATMQARMMTRGMMLQDGMVSVGDPQVKDELFAGTEKFAAGASDVTDVNLGPDMLGMVSGKHGGNMAHKLNFMVVRTYEYPKPGMYNLADVDVYRQKLKAGNWNCFIHTHESKTGESTDICNRPLPDGQGNEMVIMTVEPKELTFIHMSGTGSLADLSKLGALGGYGGSIPTPPEPPAPPAAPHP
jgi:hypothetical protein